MKKIFISIVVLAALAFGALYGVAQLAPVDKIRNEAVRVVKEKTGRDLSFEEVKIVFWPSIGVRLTNVAFGNPDWAAEKNMVTLGELDVSLAVMPLLQEQVKIEKFILNQPVIYLEKNSADRNNWTFGTAGAGAGDKAGGAGSAAPAGIGVSFGTMQIKGGQLTFADRVAGKTTKVENIDITLDMPRLGDAAKLSGALDYNGQRLTLNLALDAPMDLAAGKESKGSLDLSSALVTAAVTGTFSTAGTLLKDGAIDAGIPDLGALAAWAGGGEKKELPFKKISFKSNATASADRLALSGASLVLDDIQAGGDVTVNLAGAVPDIHARLKIGKLNLDRFAGGEGAPAAAPAKGGSDDWDDTPIDFSGLKAVNADLVLDTEGFSVKGADVGASTLTVLLRGGDLSFKSSEATLFGGRFASTARVNAAAATPALAFTFKMNGVEAQPVLATFAGFKKLTGTVEADIDVTATGRSQKAIINNLNGKGATVFRNGALTGIDLVRIAKAIQGGLAGMGIGEGKTEFVELGGTFTIANGVASNKDLAMKGPLLQATGAGDVDLPKKHVNYRVVPVLTASSAVEGASGISVPVVISGPFSGIRATPDLRGVVDSIKNNPDAIKNTIKDAKENLKEIKSDPKAALGNLLGGGGLLGGKKKSPEAATPAPAPEAAPAPAVPAEAAPAPAVESAPQEAAGGIVITPPAEEAPAAEAAPAEGAAE